METVLDDISTLFEDDDAESGRARCARAFQGLAPLLVLVTDADGNLVACDGPEETCQAGEASSVAAEIAARLARAEACRFPLVVQGAIRLVLGIRLPAQADGLRLGCVLESAQTVESLGQESLAAVLGAVLASSLCECRTANRRLNTRVHHLLAERQILKISHAEAIAAAVEERETRLREQESHTRQLQAVMMMAADGIVMVDAHGTVTSFNEAASRIFGYTAAEVVGQRVSMLVPSHLRLRHEEHLAEYLKNKPPGSPGFSAEVAVQRKDGTVFPLDIGISEVQIGERRIFTGFFRDISRRKAAEEELRRLHLQNEMILNSAGEGIVGVDAGDTVTFVNPAAARMLGYEVDELIGRSAHETIHHCRSDGTPYAKADCPIHASLRGVTTARISNECFWRKDGVCIPVEYTSTPIFEAKEIVGAVITFQDITERKVLETRLRQAQKMESIGQLAAGIAHEINTPTQYIGDNTRFLDDVFVDLNELLIACKALQREVSQQSVSPDTLARIADAAEKADVDYLLEEIPKSISQSLEGVQRVAKIVRSMKEFSHPGGDEKQAIDLNRAIESTLTVSRNEWKYVADVVTDFDLRLPLIPCLPGDFNQVVLNLVVNAAHAIADKVGATGEKGTIAVSTRHDGDWAEIRIRDTGMGIPEKIRAKIYDPFFTTKPVGRGTGQGLAIAHSIIAEKHRGTIDFETAVGEGTTFILRLPIHERSAAHGSPVT